MICAEGKGDAVMQGLVCIERIGAGQPAISAGTTLQQSDLEAFANVAGLD